MATAGRSSSITSAIAIIPGKGGACISCKVAKSRCDRMVPCSRCKKLCLECVPTALRLGRPSKLSKPYQPGSKCSSSQQKSRHLPTPNSGSKPAPRPPARRPHQRPSPKHHPPSSHNGDWLLEAAIIKEEDEEGRGRSSSGRGEEVLEGYGSEFDDSSFTSSPLVHHEEDAGLTTASSSSTMAYSGTSSDFMLFSSSSSPPLSPLTGKKRPRAVNDEEMWAMGSEEEEGAQDTDSGATSAASSPTHHDGEDEEEEHGGLNLGNEPWDSACTIHAEALSPVYLLPGHFAYPPKAPPDMPVADRASFLRDYRNNPYISEFYYRSAALLILTEFSRLKRLQALDTVKVTNHLKSLGMTVLRFGGEDYLRMMLQVESSMIGLTDWEHVISKDGDCPDFLDSDKEVDDSDFLEAKEEMEAMLQSGEENLAPLSYSITVLGRSVTYCNSRYRELFLDGNEELEAFNSQRIFPPFLWGKALCPDDHPAFFAAVVDATCSVGCESGESSLVVKCLTRAGDEFLSLARFRSCNTEHGVGHAFSVIALPPSRHAMDASLTTSTITDGKEAAASILPPHAIRCLSPFSALLPTIPVMGEGQASSITTTTTIASLPSINPFAEPREEDLFA